LIVKYTYLLNPLLGSRDQSGDDVYFYENDSYILFALIDVLGHGKSANKVACLIVELLEDSYKLPLKEIINIVDVFLSGKRGAVMFLGKLNKNTSSLSYIKIGNTMAYLLGNRVLKLNGRDGVLGLACSQPTIKHITLVERDTLIICSDGVFQKKLEKLFDDFKMLSIYKIAKRIILNCSKEDDVSCIVLRLVGEP